MESAASGIIAGINACRRLLEKFIGNLAGEFLIDATYVHLRTRENIAVETFHVWQTSQKFPVAAM